MLTEFTEAFMSVLLILLPFLVIDLVVTNLLVALGATSLPPATVALPLKVLAFVLMDGWKLIVQGVVLGYAYGS
jgi:flagellar biosynthesis protein FliP